MVTKHWWSHHQFRWLGVSNFALVAGPGRRSCGNESQRACLSQRIDDLLALLTASNFSAEIQIEARALWQEVKELSKFRNRVAHNPICLGRDTNSNEINFSVIDLKKMIPVGDNALEPLSYKQIAEVALRARDINRSLSLIIEST